ncbi:helix-turn-helix domain-containing protein, partial [Streptomyces lydicus]|uniref:helix-turn-helix domain-containing protein n=1 Tax=Streptomyces lydicus TaxID=47763 RepID=UPI0036EF9D60
MSELIAAVDALVTSEAVLPPPSERRRLRDAHGLSQDQVARTLQTRRATFADWEAGKTQPKGDKRKAYAYLLECLAQKYPATPHDPAQDTQEAPAPPPALEAFTGLAPTPQAQTPAPVTGPAPAKSTKAAAPAGRSASRRPTKKPTPVAADPRFENGPLGVLDGDGSLYCAGGLVLDCPAKTIPALVDWTLSQAELGAPRLHPAGKDADPLIVLTAAAAERFGLPLQLEDRRGLRLPEDHKVVKQLARAKWQLTRRGFGPWARIYRPAERGRRQCVQLALLPWGALDTRSWG